MSCVTCHDPHAPDEENQRRLQALEGPAGNAVCTRCHAQVPGAGGAARPLAPRAERAGSLCMNCHMVKKNMSLDTQLGRYHRIGSPTDPRACWATGRWSARSATPTVPVAALVADMERMYGKSYDRDALQRLYGDLRPERPSGHPAARQAARAGRRHIPAWAEIVAAMRCRCCSSCWCIRIRCCAITSKKRSNRSSGLQAPADFDLHQDNAKILAGAKSWLGSGGEAPVGKTNAEPPVAPGSDDE